MVCERVHVCSPVVAVVESGCASCVNSYKERKLYCTGLGRERDANEYEGQGSKEVGYAVCAPPGAAYKHA